MFVDESAASERSADRKFGWAPVGAIAHTKSSLHRSKRWSILPAYTIDGYIAWEILQASFTTELFNEFIINRVLPLCTPYPGPRSVLVMDNARIHHSEVCGSLRPILIES